MNPFIRAVFDVHNLPPADFAHDQANYNERRRRNCLRVSRSTLDAPRNGLPKFEPRQALELHRRGSK